MSEKKSATPLLVLGALGVVYGDIGTSPLYALSSIFIESKDMGVHQNNVLGAVSLIIWLLFIIVTLKYVFFVMRADNNGEGGIIALLTLAVQSTGYSGNKKRNLLLFGAVGAACFFADSIITPAISVLSAVEGLKVVNPDFAKYVLPLSVGILIGLFLVQRKGTGRIGLYFGYVILLWFGTLFFSGLYGIAQNLDIIYALNPLYGIEFLYHNPINIVFILGAAVLAVTGVEALYVDMGHFGKKPVQIGWLSVVFPALIVNYMGQGAELLNNPQHLNGLFFHLFPDYLTIPAVIIATIATIIASQAVISGAFSLVRSAMFLDLIPRMRIVQTSIKEYGQIYVPLINYLLFFMVLLVIALFQTSSALVAAYGIAVTGTMLISTCIVFLVCLHHWKFPLYLTLLIVTPLLIIETALFGSTLIRIVHGGWLPLGIAALIITMVSTWIKGRSYLRNQVKTDDVELEFLVEQLHKNTSLVRVPRTAIYLCANQRTAPQALLHNMKHNMVLHDNNIFLHISFLTKPWVQFSERILVTKMANGFWRVNIQYGYMNVPNIPHDLELAKAQNVIIDQMACSYFLSIENIVPSKSNRILNSWRQALFIALHRNAVSVVNIFKIPTNNVVELGSRITI